MKTFARMTKAERFAEAERHAGKLCRVTYTTLKGDAATAQTAEGRVIGAAEHLTNATSRGELILDAGRGRRWLAGALGYHAVSISLPNVLEIVDLEDGAA